MNQFSRLVIFVPYVTSSTASDTLQMFFDHIVCKFGMPKKIINDHDPKFILEFGTTLTAKLGIEMGFSSLYQP